MAKLVAGGGAFLYRQLMFETIYVGAAFFLVGRSIPLFLTQNLDYHSRTMMMYDVKKIFIPIENALTLPGAFELTSRLASQQYNPISYVGFTPSDARTMKKAERAVQLSRNLRKMTKLPTWKIILGFDLLSKQKTKL